MNLKEVTLEEIELHRSVLEEGLSSLLHSIIFVRAPSGVRPEEHRCAILEPLVYAKCSGEVDLSVTNAVKLIAATAAPIGPHLSRGTVSLSFYEQREAKGFFGLVCNADKIIFERWHIPVIISDTELGSSPSYDGEGGLSRAGADLARLHSLTRAALHDRILLIIDTANQSIDHVPASMYEYEIDAAAHGSEKQRHIFQKLISNSYSINLS